MAAYNITKYDEKYTKPKQGQSNKAEKYSYLDELLFLGKQKPGIYDSINLVSFYLSINSFYRIKSSLKASIGKSGLKLRKK